MHSISGLLIMILISFLAADELRMEDFFTEVKPAFPPLAERETLPEDQIRELQKQWEDAKKTGLLKDRSDMWGRLGTVDFSKYWSWFLRYNNREIIDIVLEMTHVEYECYQKYLVTPAPELIDNMDYIKCVEERKPQGDEDEFAYYYRKYISCIAISTLEPGIFDIVLSSFFSTQHAQEEYFLTIDVESHLDAILDGIVVSGDLCYKYKGINARLSLCSTELIVRILIKYPELGWKYRDKIFSLINATINSPEDRVAGHARRLQRCMDIIIRMHQTTEGECVAEGEEE